MSLPDRELRHFFPSIPSGKTLGFTVQGKKCTTFFFSLQELLICLFLLSTLIYFLFLFYFPWFMVEWFLICLLGFETIFLISWLNMRGYSKAGFYHGYFWNFASLNYTFMKKNKRYFGELILFLIHRLLFLAIPLIERELALFVFLQIKYGRLEENLALNPAHEGCTC